MVELRDMLAALADPSDAELDIWRAVGRRESLLRRQPGRLGRVLIGVASVVAVWAFMFMMGGVR